MKSKVSSIASNEARFYNVHPACSRQQVHDSWNVDLYIYINDNLHVNEEHALKQG